MHVIMRLPRFPFTAGERRGRKSDRSTRALITTVSFSSLLNSPFLPVPPHVIDANPHKSRNFDAWDRDDRAFVAASSAPVSADRWRSTTGAAQVRATCARRRQRHLANARKPSSLNQRRNHPPASKSIVGMFARFGKSYLRSDRFIKRQETLKNS